MQPPLQRQIIIGVIASVIVIALIMVATRGPARTGAGAGATFSQQGGAYGSGASGSGSAGRSGGADGAGNAGPSGSAAAAQALLVDVAGAVRNPGVYELAQGARALDAIRLAGGVLGRADLTAINRAAKLVDGQQLIVPVRKAASARGVGVSTSAGSSIAAGGSGSSGVASPTHPVSLNGGSVADFDTLPGIGPMTAQKIIDDRAAHGPFKSVRDLDRVPGIGPATIADVEKLVTP